MDNNGFIANIDGRCCPELADQVIIEQFYIETASDAIKRIIDNNYSGIVTYTNVATIDTTVTNNYNNETGWSSIVDICRRAGADCYIDSDLDLHVFVKNSITNTDVSLGYGVNIKNVSRYGIDTTNLRNRIILYGKEIGTGVIFLTTKDDETNQNDYWRKDSVENDNNAETMNLLDEKSDFLLNDKTLLDNKGGISAVGLPKLNPGDKIYISVKDCGIHETHRIQSFNFSWDNSGFNTNNIQISEKFESLAKLFKERIDGEKALKPYNNLNSMKYGYTIGFSESPSLCNHSNTEETNDGRLQLQTGESTGIMTSNSLTLTEEVTHCEFRIYGNYPETDTDTYEISADGGENYITVNAGVLSVFEYPGNSIVIRMTLTTSGGTKSPMYEGVCVLCK